MGRVRPRAAVIATIGVLAIAASAYFDWSGTRTAEIIPLRRLLFVGDVGGDAPSYWLSMAAPLAVIGGIGVIGALLLSRVVLLIAFLLATATTTLWVVTEIREPATTTFGIDSVRLGGWILLGGLLLTLIGLIALRARADEYDDEDDDAALEPFSPAPPSAYQASPDDSTRIGPGTTGTTTTPIGSGEPRPASMPEERWGPDSAPTEPPRPTL